MNTKNNTQSLRGRYSCVLISFLYLFLLSIWSINQPFNSCPDEAMRFDIVRFIFENNKLPAAFDSSIWDQNYGFSYAAQPQLPYIISSVFMKLISYITTKEFALLMAARFQSILCGALFAGFVIKISDLVFVKNELKTLFSVLCICWPQNSFVFTYVNCDSMAMLSVAVIIYYCAKTYKYGWHFSDCFGFSIGLSLALLSYLNVYIFVVLAFLYYCYYYIFVDVSNQRYKDFFKYGFIIFGFVFLFSGWHFIRNIIIYDGNVFAQNVFPDAEKIAATGFKSSERASNARYMLSSLRGNISWINSTSVSFVGMFGYMSVPLDIWMYAVYFLEIFLGVVLFIVNCFKGKNKKKYLTVATLSIIIAVLVIGQSYYYSHKDYQPQGRYILPLLIPLCMVMAFGLEKMISVKNGKKILKYVIPILNVLMLIRCVLIIISV